MNDVGIDSHGANNGCKLDLMRGGKILFKDLLLFGYGKEGKDSPTTVVDDADEEWELLGSDLQEAADVMQAGDIANDEDGGLL